MATKAKKTTDMTARNRNLNIRVPQTLIDNLRSVIAEEYADHHTGWVASKVVRGLIYGYVIAAPYERMMDPLALDAELMAIEKEAKD